MKHLVILALAFGSSLALATHGGPHEKEGWMTEKFQQMDTDKDGKVTETEHTTSITDMHKKMDTNGDGSVTTEEMDTWWKSDMESMHGKEHKGKGWHGAKSADRFKTMDTNGDGKVSAEEHSATAKTMFTSIDTNKDGSLTMPEIEASHKMAKSMGHGLKKGVEAAKDGAKKMKDKATH